MATVIDKLLASKFYPKAEEFQKALGLAPMQAEILWAGLSVAGEDGVIDNFRTVAMAVANNPSVTITLLGKRKVIMKTGKRGSWKLTVKAEAKIEKLLTGKVTTEAEPEIPASKRTVRGKKAAAIKEPAAEVQPQVDGLITEVMGVVRQYGLLKANILAAQAAYDMATADCQKLEYKLAEHQETMQAMADHIADAAMELNRLANAFGVMTAEVHTPAAEQQVTEPASEDRDVDMQPA